MKFTKMQGAGNDYIYFDCFKETVSEPEKLAVRLSDRHFGVGGDGIVLIMPSECADVRMRMFNADGSEGNMCGNAIRCVAKYAYERGIAVKESLDVETKSGIKHIDLTIENGRVTCASVDMGRVSFTPEDVPVKSKKEMVNRIIKAGGEEYFATCLSVGNPHCVIFCENTADIRLEKTGPKIENHELFPERINTEFITVKGDREIDMRVWERGSGETWACGTGACASAAACVKNGIMPYDSDIKVNMKGGSLIIRCFEDGRVIMTGPAEFVFEGELL